MKGFQRMNKITFFSLLLKYSIRKYEWILRILIGMEHLTLVR